MGGKPKYTCTLCGREVGKDNLKVKRVVFREMGKGGSSVKTRTVAWLCIVPHDDGMPSCLEQDEDWKLPLYATSPGMRHTVLAKEVDNQEQDEPLFPPVDEVLELDERLRHMA